MKGKTAFIITLSLIGISLILVIVSIALTGGFIPEEVPWDKKDNSGMAYAMMQDFIKDRLKSPSTTVFPSRNDITIRKSEFTYSITGYVDAQNSFGAIIRTRYNGEIRQIDKDRWTLVNLNFVD